jgi:hypothetical protein
MNKEVRALGLLPIWLLTKALQPFLPKAHPWKGKKLGLAWWVEGATPDVVQLGWLLWMSWVTAGLGVWLLVK